MKFNPGFVILSITFLLAGCGEKANFSPQESFPYHHLKPKSNSINYKLENVFSMHSQAVSNPNVKEQVVSLPQQTWATRLTLDMELTWQGYKEHKSFSKWPLAVFDMEVDNIQLEESDTLPDWLWSWEEKIGSNPPVIFNLNGLTIHKPMGEMLGDPRDYYLQGHNSLSYTPNGEVARNKKGELISKLKYLDHPAFIGQYFLGGLALDEILHRCICPLPPIELNDHLVWEKPYKSQLKGDKNETFSEKWKAELRDREGQKLWKINMSLKENLPKGQSKVNQANFQYWILERQIEAWVDPEQGICEEITIQEAGSWIDILSYQNKNNQMIHHPHRHRFKNRFHLSRS